MPHPFSLESPLPVNLYLRSIGGGVHGLKGLVRYSGAVDHPDEYEEKEVAEIAVVEITHCSVFEYGKSRSV